MLAIFFQRFQNKKKLCKNKRKRYKVFFYKSAVNNGVHSIVRDACVLRQKPDATGACDGARCLL